MMPTAVTLVLLSAWLAAVAVLPADARLLPVKGRMQAALEVAEREELPADLLVSKMREGLAKRVPAPLIATAVERLVVVLQEVRELAQRRSVSSPSPRLLQALAEARLANVGEEQLGRLLAAQGNETNRRLAIESLSDLKLRGCEPEVAAPLVESLLRKDPKSLALLPSLIQSLRQDFALTNAEAAFSIENGLRNEASLQRAATRARNENAALGKGARANEGLSDDGGNKGRGVQSNPGKGKGIGRNKP